MQDQWSSADEQFLICEFDLDGEQRSGSLHEFGISELVVDTDPATLEQIDRHMKTLTPIESLHTNDGDTNTGSVVFADLFTTGGRGAEDSSPR